MWHCPLTDTEKVLLGVMRLSKPPGSDSIWLGASGSTYSVSSIVDWCES